MPQWISTALESVRNWVRVKAFDYHFLGDEFFTWAPEWIRQRYAQHFFPITDIARLFLLQDALQRGYDRVIWLDADVLVFAPARLDLSSRTGALFCREHMLSRMPTGVMRAPRPGINNAAMAFDAGNPLLSFYIYACEALLRPQDVKTLERTSLGPSLLQRLALVLPLECTEQVGLFTPALMQELALGQTRMASLYAKHAAEPLAAANLCHFFRHGANEQTRRQVDAVYARAINALLDSEGSVINQFFQHSESMAEIAIAPLSKQSIVETGQDMENEMNSKNHGQA